MELPPQIEGGKRAMIAGRTGSGKSTLACWLLQRSPQHWLILNPKHTAAYKTLPDVQVCKRFMERQIARELMRSKFTLLNLSGDQASAGFMDEIVEWLHDSYTNIGLCVDELYTLHFGSGRAGDGLTGWLTRGRERKQSFIGLTQRPVWISRFLLSEADYICAMDLVLEDDRLRMMESTGQAHFADRVRGYRWLFYDVQGDRLNLYGPVPA